jgi:hypothetical protein
MPLTGKAPTTATDALARMLVDGVIIMAGAFHDIPQISVSTRCEADTEPRWPSQTIAAPTIWAQSANGQIHE